MEDALLLGGNCSVRRGEAHEEVEELLALAGVGGRREVADAAALRDLADDRLGFVASHTQVSRRAQEEVLLAGVQSAVDEGQADQQTELLVGGHGRGKYKSRFQRLRRSRILLPLRVLHLYSNHKLTGPAELALETVRALALRGVDARFFSSDVKEQGGRTRRVQRTARERGVPEAELTGLRLPKHISPLRALLDVRALRSHLRADPPDVVHCHLPGDHLVAGLAARGLGVPVVRTLYDGTPPPPTARRRLAWGRLTRVLICASEAVAQAVRDRAEDYGIDPVRVVHFAPPIDVRRFDPTRGLAPRREALGVPEDAFCVGIVARMQTHRRFELLFEAVRRARAEAPSLHLVVVGRGTHQELVARRPVEELGLGDCVHFSGYVSGEDYARTLASFDAKVFLVPGSDGTCRAVREALAMGVPVVATRRGMLPELVRDGEDGLLVDETPAALAEALVTLARDPERRRVLAAEARRGAVERFAYEVLAERLEGLYRDLPTGA
ncbi:MAG: glycosyltransferase family 1 protein [Planctomycetota bacterium]|nr:MAG: glycosyltransferase family 1 protein [Planctomycetota bacterium]